MIDPMQVTTMHKRPAPVTRRRSAWILGLLGGIGTTLTTGVMADEARPVSKVDLRWGVQVPMRDGVSLNANLYLPKGQSVPAPCIVTLSPYTAGRAHIRASYFASRGLPFLAVDLRGRGESPGEFRPFIRDGEDGHDTVEWLAKQPYCNGKVAMFSGSYEGYIQWATAARKPPHLATIVPVASIGPGLDFPMLNNIPYPYVTRWLTLVAGHAFQERVFYDSQFWRDKDREWFEAGRPFKEHDEFIGVPSAVFKEWAAHPQLDAYWDSFRPTLQQYREIHQPVLTVTGMYDGDQQAAIGYYRAHVQHAPSEAAAKHYLVIGPWDHAGTLNPKAEVGGVRFGPAALVDVLDLHASWYAWTMQGGSKPAFLQKRVAYYVTGAERWRYADTLDEVTAQLQPYYLGSAQNPTDVLSSGALSPRAPVGGPDRYVYDPSDTSIASIEAEVDPDSLTDQRMTYALSGRQLVYHTAPFERATELSGFFRLSAWMGIDQPDTDFRVQIYEIAPDGTGVLLTTAVMRARDREDPRRPALIKTKTPQQYDFTQFNFVSREVKQGSRLRLVFGPVNSIHSQKNFNSGRSNAEESIADARPVTVTLFHDRSRPSALFVPIARPEGAGVELVSESTSK